MEILRMFSSVLITVPVAAALRNAVKVKVTSRPFQPKAGLPRGTL